MVDRRAQFLEFAEQDEEPAPERDLHQVGDHHRQHGDDHWNDSIDDPSVRGGVRRAPCAIADAPEHDCDLHDEAEQHERHADQEILERSSVAASP